MASAGLTQKHRKAAIGTPLGDDVLVLKSFIGVEELGRLFQFNLVLLSEKDDIKFDDIIGQNVTVRLELADKKTRYFNGYVNRFVQVAPFNRFACYHATVVPWFWFLTQTADCRIFQNKTVPDIIEEVFKGHGFDNYQRSLSGSYESWEYCVQYRETDFQFVSRLMEQEGIYYFFKHENGKHTLVLADSKSAHEPFPGYEEISYRPPDRATSDFEHIRDWTIEKQLVTGVYSHTDFDFKKPKTSLLSNSSVSRDYAASNFEVFDYPGEYIKPAEGENLAKIRIQELQSRYEVMRGESDARGICSGYNFTLKDFGRADQNRKYLVLAVQHKIEPDVFASAGGDGGETPLYHASFSAIDAETPFRTARTTMKPIVQGPQTAIVVGPKGEEIYTDKYGRVKVMFHWDRYAKADENSSCWIRVSQSWAGKNWGALYLPRIGQEVIVEFLEGDPDRPIITGRVYNDAVMPPYALPDNKTMSTTKSLSSKGGGGFNEIRFEDKKGEEQIFIHGEKNQDIRIKNDCFEWIGNNRHLDVKKDQFEHVENNRHETVDADHKEKIGKDRHLSVVGKEAKMVGESLSLTVKGDVIEVFKANHSEETTADYYLKADNIVIEAMTNVTIKVGSSSIAIESSGIKIAAAQVEVEGTGTVDVKSPSTTVKGDGTLTLKGGSVMIN
jgi:type VI secretion system secreted protein VgrG